MSSRDDSVVVSSAIHLPHAVQTLERAEISLVTDAKHGAVSTGSYQASHPGAHDPQGPLPANFVDPTTRYILVEEPDKRFRIVGTDPVGKVMLLP